MGNYNLKQAFPLAIREEVSTLFSQINLHTNIEPRRSYAVNFNGECLKIPYRIYFEEHNLPPGGNLSSVQNEILHCLYTRHANGRVREHCLRKIILSSNKWIPPYVIRLVGEYVIELLEVIYDNLAALDKEVYKNFLRENKVFYNRTKQQTVSYWDCYYRQKNPKYHDYVGSKIISFFDE